jgi:hypothetical protein
MRLSLSCGLSEVREVSIFRSACLKGRPGILAKFHLLVKYEFSPRKVRKKGLHQHALVSHLLLMFAKTLSWPE